MPWIMWIAIVSKITDSVFLKDHQGVKPMLLTRKLVGLSPKLNNPYATQVMRKAVITLAALMVCSGAPAGAIYKCIGKDGKPSFSSSPVCEEAQDYARPEPVIKVDIKDVSKKGDQETIQLDFEEMELEALITLIADYAEVPVAVFFVPKVLVNANTKPMVWHQVFNQLTDKYDLTYRKAYGVVYVYPLGSIGDTIVNTPDLLRWNQSERDWEVVVEQNKLVVNDGTYIGKSFEERKSRLIMRVKDVLGEPQHSNAARYIRTRETFAAGGSGTVAANKGLYQEYINESLREENQQLKAANRSLRNQKPRRWCGSVRMTGGARCR